MKNRRRTIARTREIAAALSVGALVALMIVASARPACAQDPAAPSPVGNAANAAKQEQPSDPHGESGRRMFGVLPNYSTIEHASEIDPISARTKLEMASRNTFDPYVYPFVGFQATLNHTYGVGGSAYVKQYVTSLTDNATGNFLTSAALPSLLHQDPRYFERGTGSTLGRIAYAASRSLVTRGDSGHAQFNVSEIGGNAIAAGVSGFYYPANERTATDFLSRWAMQVMWDTLSNEMKEFWPDVRRKLHRS